MIDLYWVYDLPNWLFALLTILLFLLVGLAGLFLTRKWVKRLHQVDHSHNDIVGYYLAAVTVFYGITLGLVAVGTWNTFSAIDNKVDGEAQVIGSIYRDLATFPEPHKSVLQKDLTLYTRHVIYKSWPLQRKGIVPVGSGVFLSNFQDHLMAFKPAGISDEIKETEVFRQYNVLVEFRRARLNAVNTGLPGSLWALVIVGGLICLVVTLFFDTISFSMHFWMTALFSVLLGLMIFLIGTLDNPFRGDVGVSAKPLELVYKQLMKP